MENLRRGVQRFQAEVFPQKKHLYEKLASSQRPSALFLTCGDSRVGPELLTGSEPGEIFVERNPGNMVPIYDPRACAGVTASIEFAVAVLRVRHIIVCGHSDCGAIKGILAPDTVAHVPAVSRWLGLGKVAREVLDENYADAPDAERIRRLTQLNVLQQLKHLETHPTVREALQHSDLGIHGWVYEIHTGQVEEFHPKNGRFERLE